jgi:methyltransferase OMS1
MIIISFFPKTEIGTDEIVMGLSLIRWWNIRKAKGKVLEIGCGTGRNFPYYNFSAVSSLTAIDSVKEMLEVAATKIPSKNNAQVNLQQMNAHHLSSFPDNSFDTIIDTFGLCSYEHPCQVIHELQRVLNKSNPEARILFIEHGESHYQWLNNILYNNGQYHANHWGCIWNLKIDQIIRDAGCEIVKMSRTHLGTTYIIEARPSAHPIKQITQPDSGHVHSIYEYHPHMQPIKTKEEIEKEMKKTHNHSQDQHHTHVEVPAPMEAAQAIHNHDPHVPHIPQDLSQVNSSKNNNINNNNKPGDKK